MTAEYFGTDGIRGPVGGEVVNPLFAARLGAAVGAWVKKNGRDRPLVLIGRDTRPSGSDLVIGFASGLSSANIETHSLGIIPTPALALAVRGGTACLGVMVTASHNPASDNGFKLFDQQGHKLTTDDEAILESLLPETVPAIAANLTEKSDSLDHYLEHLARILPEGSLKNWSIALDTANGATAKASPVALERLGAKVVQIGKGGPNQLINDSVGSEFPENLSRLTRETNSCLGIAHDGDGDRVVFCDEKGEVVDGDNILGIFALDAMRRGLDGSSILVTTDYANFGLDRSLSDNGIKVVRTEVGDRCVAEGMESLGAAVGGEPSGHVILNEWSPTGDGPLAALSLARIMLERQKPLSELKQCVDLLPCLSKAFLVDEKIPLGELCHFQEQLKKQEKKLAGSGRVFVRYSGTESKIRLLVETQEERQARKVFAAIEDILRKELKFL